MKYLLLFLSTGSLLFSLAPQAHAAGDGSLIKGSTDSAVYYLVDGKRYAFPNEKVYFSWYEDFRNVLTVSQNTLASYPLAGNVTYRPGRWLVKVQTDPKVYAVSHNGVLRWVTSGQIAAGLYGPNWNTKLHDIPDTFFINYQIGAPIVDELEYSPLAELSIRSIAQNLPLPPVQYASNPQEALERRTFVLINDHRKSKGLSALLWSDTIAGIARGHSQDMATGTVAFGHDGFPGRIEAIRKTYEISGAAENVAFNQGYPDPAATAVDGWLLSPGHLENIEHAAYDQSGVGVVKNASSSYYLTQIFIQSADGR